MAQIINKDTIPGIGDGLPVTTKFIDQLNERSTSTELADVTKAIIESSIIAIAELEGTVNALMRALDAKRVD